jgi:hypothetical protein
MGSDMDTQSSAPLRNVDSFRELRKIMAKDTLWKASLDRNDNNRSGLFCTTRCREDRRQSRYTPPDMIEVHGRPHRLRPVSSFWQRRHTVRHKARKPTIV